MAVALLIKYPSSGASELVPIAGESLFRDCWIGPAVALGLEWLPLFQTGASVSSEFLPDVLHEFELIEREFDRSGALELAGRARDAARALRHILEEAPDAEVFIG